MSDAQALPMSSIRDNRRRGCVGDFLREHIRKDADLSIVSAYFTIYAYARLREPLEEIAGLRFLFGEPRFVKSLDPDRTETKAYRIEEEKLQLRNRLRQKAVARQCADWIREKVGIRSIRRSNLLHGKLYHINHNGIEKALVGSSNFTVSGLGYGAVPNIELNLEVTDDRDRLDLRNWFDELWNDEELVADVKEDILGYLSQLYRENVPDFIYFKTLYHIFEKFLLDQETDGLLDRKLHLFDTQIWTALYAFQRDGVKGAINKIERHGGCIIADSVGLGKTFEALAVMKYYELKNHRVLVLCPKKLRENWTIYQAQNNSELNPFLEDRFSYTVLCHTDLSRDGGCSGDIDLGQINWGNFDLVVIDESHNFRNNAKGKRDEEIQKYELSLFNPSKYVRPEHRGKYEFKIRNFTQAGRERFLIGMMKVNFLKRLESCVHSFAVSMERTVSKIEALEEKLRAFQVHQVQAEAVDLDELAVEDDDPETEEAWEVGRKATFSLADLDVDGWLTDLEKDLKQIASLLQEAAAVTVARDAKLAALRDLLREKALHPATTRDGRPNRKALVFTAFADTALYLYEELREWARSELGVHIALVTGGAVENRTTFGKNEYNNILTNFSPLSKNRRKIRSLPQEGEIDFLIATDCISEGQNLQDCDTLINYDIHWNPVRIIQRFGRIDRIGSRNASVRLINFWPTKDLDRYIALKDRVEARMALVDLTATADDNLLQEEIRDLIAGDLKYRDRQLKRLQEEILDPEEATDGVSLSEFTLDDFRIELANYIEANREKLEAAPLGLYAVVAAPPGHPVIRPGAIFCLRQVGETAGNETVNPLQPCFLVYIRDDGAVRFNFAQAKQILEIFRTLAAGEGKACEALCNIFNGETGNGDDMARYDDLLAKSVAVITAMFKKRAIGALLSGRDGRMIPRSRQAEDADDFELITWLVIKDADKS